MLTDCEICTGGWLNMDYGQLYNKNYYETSCGDVSYLDSEHWVKFFGNIADKIIETINPKTVLDVGCAAGYLVAALRDRGVEAYGIDVSEFAISCAREDIKPYCRVCSALEPLPDDFPKKFDLVITIEVAEHLYEEDCEKFIENICTFSENIIFSSTPDDFAEKTHLNVQQLEYWAKRFAKHGFFRKLIYDASFISPQAVYFTKKEVKYERLVEDYERHIRILSRTISNRKTHISPKHLSKIYLDIGYGFSENESVFTVEIGENGYVSHTVQLPRNVKSVRFNPVDDKLCIVENLLITSNEGVENPINVNGIHVDEFDIFDNTDPQYTLDLEGRSVEWIKIEALIYVFENADIQPIFAKFRSISSLKEAIIERDRENKELKILLQEKEEETDAENQIRELETELQRWKYMYNEICTSSCWKITKPIRLIMDTAKRMLKSNIITYKLYRGFKCIREHGIIYTMQLLKMKLRNEKRYRNIAASMGADMDPENQISCIVDDSIKFSVIVPLYNTPEKYLREMIQSVIYQTYANWELCLADGSDSEHAYIEDICMKYAQKDNRILYKKLSQNLGISGNSNACVEMSSGDYIVLLDHDDILQPNALYENARAISETHADVLYSDEDKITEDGVRHLPFFKPDWSPDLLYSQMYICHLLVIRRDLFNKIGGFDSDFDGSQDYDLMLRLCEKTDKIYHIPKILYSWRETHNSTALNADSKPYAHLAGKRALDRHLKRKYGEYAHAEDSEYTFVYDARFDLLKDAPLISIIIPMKDNHSLTDRCIRSILKKTIYQNYEIIILNNNSEEEESYRWFESIKKTDSRIKVIDANFGFNWSRLNNYGMKYANGEVYVFLNNDTEVITEDWLNRLAENALRDDIGVVGALLLYSDNTIQHAGVVVGVRGWADHIFKGMQPIHYGCPFVSPMVNRNVLAVTGACMAISRKTIRKIGDFNENFTICGSDVEICIRAYEAGLYNLYNSRVKLLHLESKSRDSYIPENDFKMSALCYDYYRENGDPFFNPNLSINSVIPQQGDKVMNWNSFKNYLKKHKGILNIYNKIKMNVTFSPDIPEISKICARPLPEMKDEYRINIIVPSINKEHLFGGISTALQFFDCLRKQHQTKARILVSDSAIKPESLFGFAEYTLVKMKENAIDNLQIMDISNRSNSDIPVAKNDIFIATGWWTAHTIAPVIKWQANYYNIPLHSLIYFIQDFEPGFYAWSSRYSIAESTYHMDIPITAVFNSTQLKDYFHSKNYKFEKEFCFSPVLNKKLREQLELKGPIRRERIIVIYGRPSTHRNAFELIVAALREWTSKQKDVSNWTVVSAGEPHPDVDLGNGIVLHSVGKLPLERYAELMLRASIGISIMISPHPSYPPLEMSTFGMKVITNCFENKDLSDFNKNIISLRNYSPENISNALLELCDKFDPEAKPCLDNMEYVDGKDVFEEICKEISLS